MFISMIFDLASIFLFYMLSTEINENQYKKLNLRQIFPIGISFMIFLNVKYKL